MTTAGQIPGEASLPDPTRKVLHELVEATGWPASKVLEVAVERYGFVLLGGEPGEEGSGGAFRKVGSDRAATVGLRQKDAKNFFLVEPFRYVKDGGQRFVPWPDDEHFDPRKAVTDLASVPELLTWLVPRYGRHSLPALLHDDLQDRFEEDGGPGAEPGLDSWKADRIFRDAMGDARVPFFRRWAMWAGVSTRTRWNSGLLWRLLIVAWVAVFGVGIGVATPVAVAFGWLGGWPLVLAIAVGFLGPVVLSPLWIREIRAGLIAGYALPVLALPLVFVGLATLVYVLLELLAKLWEPDNRITNAQPTPSDA